MSQSAESQDQKGPSRDQQAKSESEVPSDRAGGAGEPLDKANVASGAASGSAPPAAGRRRARKGRGKPKGGQASAASTNNAEGDGSPQPSAAAESAPKEEGKRPGRRRTRRNKRKGDSGQTATSREPSTKRSESQSRGRSTSRLPPCHADKWLVSRAPICSKGGQRQIDSPGDESDSIEIRDSPYLVCLHRIKPDKGAAVIRVYVDIFDRESKDFVKGKESIVLHEYVVYVQGPFLGYEAGEEHKMIWDSDGTGKENLLRISHAQNICVWDLTDPEGDAAVESPYGRELCISFNAFSEAYAINFVEALEDHLLGIYYRTEASRLSELASGMAGKKKFDAKKLKEKSHSLAAEHIFAFFNRNRSLFEIDLHHLRLTGKEAESRLIRKVRQVQETEVDSMQQEKYLEVIAGRGAHSVNKEAKLLPEVERLLTEWKDAGTNGMANTNVEPINPGSFLVVFATYDGESPCYGWFFCYKCLNTWHSRLVTLTSTERDSEAGVGAYKQKCQWRVDGQPCNEWIEPVKLSYLVPESYCRPIARRRWRGGRHNRDTCRACQAGVCLLARRFSQRR